MNRLATLMGLALLFATSTAMAQTRDTTDIRPIPKPTGGDIDLPHSSVGGMMRRRFRDVPDDLRKPALGVVLAPDAVSGVRIAAVTPNGAAATAGLRSGDRLLSIDGHALLGDNGALRVDNARKLLAGLETDTAVRISYERDNQRHSLDVTPKLSSGVVVWVDNRGQEIRATGDFVIMDRAGLRALKAAHGSGPLPPGVAPKIQREVFRLGPGGACQGNGCASPALLEAFRWNGLNLAAVDPKLGQYFGTRSGVLVISPGPELAALQPGDVIRTIDGTPVATPNEAMDALRTKPGGSQIALEILRDRKPLTTRVRIPETLKRLPPLSPNQ